MKTTHVLIADDHALVRAGLVSLLQNEPSLQVVAEASDGVQAALCIEALRPDVAIVDVNMAPMSGIDVTRRTRDAGLSTAIVLLSMHGEPSVVRAGLQAGACGYVLKQGDSRDLLAAIHAATRRDQYLSPSLPKICEVPRTSGQAELTSRETDVLRLLAEGLSTKEIAVELDIGIRTVDTHRAAIMDRLGIRNVPGLVKYAIRNLLVRLDG